MFRFDGFGMCLCLVIAAAIKNDGGTTGIRGVCFGLLWKYWLT